MATARDIVTLALADAGIVGVGQTPLAEDSNRALVRLNWMISQWARKRWMVYHLVDLGFTSTGAQSYTVGPGMNYNISVRPDKIKSAFARQLVPAAPNQVDYPLEVIESRETYNLISLKQLTSFPYYVFYDAAYPTGLLYPWPIPQAGLYAVHITVEEVLVQLASLNTTVIFPDEYQPALHSNLVCILRAAYRLPVDPFWLGKAKADLNVVKNANEAISRLRMPAELAGRGAYNIYSDQFR